MSEWERFDRELSDVVGDLPPSDNTVKSITPWGHCMEQVILGLVLTSFTLSFLWLQYLLPAVGVANLYLAFRTLRGNNRYFKVCWWLSGLKVGLFAAGTLLAATPLSSSAVTLWLLGYPNAVTTLLLYFFFRLGLRQAAKDVGQKPASDPMLGALIWFGVLLVLVRFLPDGGWLVFIPMVTAFIVIVKLLTEVTADLDTWGYQVQAATVRISADVWRRWFYGGLLVLTVLFTLFFAHQSPKSQPASPPHRPGVRSSGADRTGLPGGPAGAAARRRGLGDAGCGVLFRFSGLQARWPS